MTPAAAVAGSVGFSWKASRPWIRVTWAGRRWSILAYAFGQVSTVTAPPPVSVVKRAGFGLDIAAQTFADVANAPGSIVPSIRSYIVQLPMKLTRSVRKAGS